MAVPRRRVDVVQGLLDGRHPLPLVVVSLGHQRVRVHVLVVKYGLGRMYVREIVMAPMSVRLYTSHAQKIPSKWHNKQ